MNEICKEEDENEFLRSPFFQSFSEEEKEKFKIIEELYEIKTLVKIIIKNNYKRVAIQLPQCFLSDMSFFYLFLNEKLQFYLKKYSALPFVNLFLLGDSLCNGCCVDTISASKYNADFIVHIGNSCLSLNEGPNPIFFIFDKINLHSKNIKALTLELEKLEKQRREDVKKEKTILIYDLCHDYVFPKILQSILFLYISKDEDKIEGEVDEDDVERQEEEEEEEFSSTNLVIAMPPKALGVGEDMFYFELRWNCAASFASHNTDKERNKKESLKEQETRVKIKEGKAGNTEKERDEELCGRRLMNVFYDKRRNVIELRRTCEKVVLKDYFDAGQDERNNNVAEEVHYKILYIGKTYIECDNKGAVITTAECKNNCEKKTLTIKNATTNISIEKAINSSDLCISDIADEESKSRPLQSDDSLRFLHPTLENIILENSHKHAIFYFDSSSMHDNNNYSNNDINNAKVASNVNYTKEENSNVSFCVKNDLSRSSCEEEQKNINVYKENKLSQEVVKNINVYKENKLSQEVVKKVEEETKMNLLMKRFVNLEKVEKAKHVAILITNPSIKNVRKIHKKIIKYIRLLKGKDKSVMSLMINKIDETNLENFPDVDLFCVLGCPLQNNILYNLSKAKKFRRSFISTHELLLGLQIFPWKCFITESLDFLLSFFQHEKQFLLDFISSSFLTRNEQRQEVSLVDEENDSAGLNQNTNKANDFSCEFSQNQSFLLYKTELDRQLHHSPLIDSSKIKDNIISYNKTNFLHFLRDNSRRVFQGTPIYSHREPTLACEGQTGIASAYENETKN